MNRTACWIQNHKVALSIRVAIFPSRINNFLETMDELFSSVSQNVRGLVSGDKLPDNFEITFLEIVKFIIFLLLDYEWDVSTEEILNDIVNLISMHFFLPRTTVSYLHEHVFTTGRNYFPVKNSRGYIWVLISGRLYPGSRTKHEDCLFL